jgi:hypothetical protein
MPSAKIIPFSAKPKARKRSAKAAKAKPPLTGAAMENAAYYIAGSVAVARGMRVSVDGAAINPRWKHQAEVDLGYGWCRDLETWHLICLAGPYAQRRFSPRSEWQSGNNDFDIVKKELSREFGPILQKPYQAFLEDAAQRLVDYFWAEIAAVAKALLEHGRLTGREIRALTNEAQSERPSPRHPLADYRALPWHKKFDFIEAFGAPEIPLLNPDDDDTTLIISLFPYIGQGSI